MIMSSKLDKTMYVSHVKHSTTHFGDFSLSVGWAVDFASMLELCLSFCCICS